MINTNIEVLRDLYEKLLEYDKNEKPVCFGCFGYPICYKRGDGCQWIKRCKASQEDY